MGADTGPDGLTTAEVRDRVERGLVNDGGERTSRTLREIVRANVFTRFNAILGVMLGVVIVIGKPADGLFAGVMISNALIGIVQEVRAKRTLDRLAVLSAPRARVVRDGDVIELAVEGIVLDDLCELRTGDQVPCDGLVRDATGLQLDESLLTGESDPINKAAGAEVLSGSFVVAGSGRFQATRVGADAYARQLATEARRFELTRSELMDGVNLVLRLVTYAIVPIAGLLLWSQYDSTGHDWREALGATVAGVVGMVPQGLVLLTSIAFGVAALSLARRRVLVQELPAVEGLARVDVVCLDKTGTLTEGEVVFDRMLPAAGAGDDVLDLAGAALGAMAADPNANATLRAVATSLPEPDGWSPDGAVPFSSARKWSATAFAGQGSWVLGAPEMVWPEAGAPVRAQADEQAARGSRVLLLARTDDALRGEELPDGLQALALVLLHEKVRPDAAEALRYFDEQGVRLRVISGDNPRTVGAVAARVGLPDADRVFDARELPEDLDALAGVLDAHAVFGRVTPHQKRAMVKALQSRGHVVAMTGDGVNDALALKDADIGVAMGSGAAATRSVAQLVLLDGEFSTMPGVVAEGRRVIANIERVANLFVTKTVYSSILALVFAITAVVLATGWVYPLLGRHVSLIGDLTIGIPAFFLSLAPNARRYIPGFIRRVLRFAVPAGLIAAFASFLAYGLARAADVSQEVTNTAAILVLLTMSLWVLVIVARPFTPGRVALVASIVAVVVVVLAVPALRDFFELELPTGALAFEVVAVSLSGGVLLEVVARWFD
ncbi:MAG: HAD-IC family P-type ATPase [Acidimicrobiia bacterium]